MNVQKHSFDFELEGYEVEEVLRAVFHTVLLHRCYAKISAKDGGNCWTFGAAGFTDEDCEAIDVTYARVTCDEVVSRVNQPIRSFVSQLRAAATDDSVTGAAHLEFHEQKRAKWGVFSSDPVPWEIWTVRVVLVSPDSESARRQHREQLTQAVSEAILGVNDIMVSADTYKPKLVRTSEFEQILDMQCPALTPHHFRLHFAAGNQDTQAQAGVGGAMKKILKDTLAL